MGDNTIRHVFICANRKTNGKGCARFGTEDIIEYFKRVVADKKHLFHDQRRVKVVKTSCLGRCSVGPNIFISPDNIWYTFHSNKDIDNIIESHFVNNQVLERCLQKPLDVIVGSSSTHIQKC